MGMMDKVKQMANKNKAKIAGGVDKGTDAIDDKTGRQHHDKLQKADDLTDRAAGKPKDTDTDR